MDQLKANDKLAPLKTYWSIWATAVVAFVGWITGQTLITFAFMAVEAAVILALYKDLMHVLSPAWFFLYVRAEGVALAGSWLWLLALIPIIAGIVIHIIRFRPPVFAKQNVLRGFSLSFIVAGITFALGGVTISGRTGYVVAILVAFGLLLPLIYLFLSASIEQNAGEKLMKYVAMLMYTLAIMAIIQTCVFFIRLGSLSLIKEAVKFKLIELGWGGANEIAPVVGMAIPIAGYYSLKKGKWAWAHLLFASLAYAWAYICTCRGVILFGSVALLAVIIYGFKKTQNRLQMSIVFGAMVAVAAIMIGVFYRQVHDVFEEVINRGMSDNGRYPLYTLAVDRFKLAPIFGVGLDYDMGGFDPSGNSTVPYYYHSTPFQALCCLGLVGLIAHAILYYWRYRTFLTSRHSSLAMALMCGLFVYDAYSWVDRNFFMVPSAVLMMIVTLAADKNVPTEQVKPHTVRLVDYIIYCIKNRPIEPADLDE